MMDTPATPTAGWLPSWLPAGSTRLSPQEHFAAQVSVGYVQCCSNPAPTQVAPPGPAQPPALCGCPSISAPVCSSGLQSSAHLPRATRGPRLLPQKHPANPSMTNTSSGIRLSEESMKGNSRVQGSLGTGPSPPSLTSMPAVLVRVTSSGGRSLSRPRVPAASLPAPCLLPVVST